ncbi:hypothetical protein Bca101_027220 [Brassica carinata]
MDHRKSRETSRTGTCRIGSSGRKERSVSSVGFAIRSSVRLNANGSSGRMLSGSPGRIAIGSSVRAG